MLAPIELMILLVQIHNQTCTEVVHIYICLQISKTVCIRDKFISYVSPLQYVHVYLWKPFTV